MQLGICIACSVNDAWEQKEQNPRPGLVCYYLSICGSGQMRQDNSKYKNFNKDNSCEFGAGPHAFLQLGCFGLDFTSFCNCIL